MDRRLIAEILATHADRLIQGQKAKAREILSLFSEDHNLEPLLEVAEEVKETMAPVKPPLGFRQDLEMKLLAEAQETLGPQKPAPGLAKSGLLFLLALLGSLLISIVGVIAYILRGRKPRRPQTAH